MDFGSGSGVSSKASMKRKQSSGLLGAFRGGRDRQSSNAPPLPPSSYSSPPPNFASPSEPESPYAESFSSHTASLQSQSQHGHRPPDSATSSSIHTPYERDLPSASLYANSGGRTQRRIVSNTGSTMSSAGDSGKGKDRAGSTSIKRPEDIFRVTRDRLFGWSFLMQWYQGDVHWFNTVKIPHTAVEQSLGAQQLELRARNFFVLGMSMAPLFDIPGVLDFLRAMIKLLDEWEQWSENSGKVKNLFRGGKKGKTGSVSGDFIVTDSETSLVTANMPFIPDFFQVHSSTCSMIRDVYKKILRSVLPPPPTNWRPPKHNADFNLHHPSTIIHAAPLDGAFPLPTQSPSVSMSPPAPASAASSAFGAYPTINADTLGPSPRMEEFGIVGSTPLPTKPDLPSGGSVQLDGFQALIAGELPSDRTLVGGGERLSPGIIEMFLKVDAKLKKQFSTLLGEGHDLARQTIDQEISALLYSLTPGTGPMRFDLEAAMTQQGNGYIPEGFARPVSRSSGQSSSGHGHPQYGHSYGLSVSSTGGGSLHGYGGGSKSWSREGSDLREEEETEE